MKRIARRYRFRKRKQKQLFQQEPNHSFIPVQTKLKVSHPSDKYEKEADKVANKVISRSQNTDNGFFKASPNAYIPSEQDSYISEKPIANSITPLIQKQEKKELQAMPIQKQEEEAIQAKAIQKQEAEEEELLQTKAIQKQEEEEEEMQPKLIQKQEEEEEEEPVQTKANEGQHTSPSIEAKLNNSASKGSKMAKDTQMEMESNFGTNFSDVRIHTDSDAVDLNQKLNAQAFTHKNDIYFNKNKYNPNSKSGQQLLAHELTHTIQQSSKNTNTDESMVARAITTPLKSYKPKVNQKTRKTVTFTLNGVKVIVKPDGKLAGRSNANKAKTNFSASYATPSYRHMDGVLTTLGTIPTPTITIQTKYGIKVNAQSPSAYGKGTTVKDKKEGNTSLGYHEGSHGTDFLNYIKKNAVPQFNSKVGDTVTQYNDAINEYSIAGNKYKTAMQAYSEKLSDCVGTKAGFCPTL